MTLKERTEALLAQFKKPPASPPPNQPQRQLANNQSKVQAALSPTDGAKGLTALEASKTQTRALADKISAKALPSNDNPTPNRTPTINRTHGRGR